ncbi:MAG: hypothetical protein ACI9JN_002417 [Bacteroidia bacterium]|jgi:hypothetical protein
MQRMLLCWGLLVKYIVMRNYILILFASLLLTACGGDEVPVIKGNDIEFKATCNTLCSATAFIDRGREIIWEETLDFTNTLELSHNFDLQVGDKVLLFVMPRDGEVHLIKTEIYIDEVLQANQNKVCHAGGGCSFTTK